MIVQPDGYVLQVRALRCLTLAEWMAWRKAQNMDVMTAVRRLMEDIDDGASIALAERDCNGYVVH